MADTPSTLHCLSCLQPLPEGEEPEYFATSSTGWDPEQEAERTADAVDQCLRYAQTVNSAIWDMLRVADVNHRDLPEKESCLNAAQNLCSILIDLIGETERRVHSMANSVAGQARREEQARAKRHEAREAVRRQLKEIYESKTAPGRAKKEEG
jgi:hypothetical protein